MPIVRNPAAWARSSLLWRSRLVARNPARNAELERDSARKSAWGRLDGFAFQTEWSNRDGKAELEPTAG